MDVQKINNTHKSGGVVVPDGFGITICLKDWICLNNLIFKSSSLKTENNKTLKDLKVFLIVKYATQEKGLQKD